ncbi:syntaxin-51-like [Tripterygium wilfordii]|uniref:Syntaxin-51-like n=1 Tax=Tripterygium wilfordii TaxID=458696 RepID=A0A7J7CUN4_TRIWF|nr:syntaxin-51-like [Tripterygium wilfordii]
MASPAESWTREFNEASKLAADINGMISGRSSLPPSGPETQRHLSATRRKITILRTKIDTLQTLLHQLPAKQKISAKEINRRQEMLKNLTSKANQMATTLNMSGFGNRDSLLGPDRKSDDLISRTTGLDNQGLVGFQRQIMREQDDGLEKLEGTVTSTKHIALAINEELKLHTGLLVGSSANCCFHFFMTFFHVSYFWKTRDSIFLPLPPTQDDLDEHVDGTNSRLQRVQRKLAILNRNTKGGCSCLILLVIGVVILIVVIWAMIKYL